MAGKNVKATHQDGTEFEGPVDSGNPHAKRPADQKKGDMNFDASAILDNGKVFDSGKVAEQIDALFAGIPNLSEDFSSRAAVIIEGALSERTEVIREALEAEYDARLEETVAEVNESYHDRLDAYLDYVVEQFMQENQVAIEQGIKSEIAEQVLQSVTSIIEANGVTIPEDKVDVAEALAEEIRDIENKLNTQIERNFALSESVRHFEVQEAFREISEGMSSAAREKLANLAENISYRDMQDYKNRVTILKETFSDNKPSNVTMLEQLNESIDSKEKTPVNSRMAAYLAMSSVI